jgi:hypothetical protein
MRIQMTDGVRTLHAGYLDAGHIAHGYATTIHKAQGATTDRCLLLATDGLYRQAAYVALSRGRTTNHLYAVGTPHIDPELTHAPPARQRPHDLIRDALHRAHSKDLALKLSSLGASEVGDDTSLADDKRPLLIDIDVDPRAPAPDGAGLEL